MMQMFSDKEVQSIIDECPILVGAFFDLNPHYIPHFRKLIYNANKSRSSYTVTKNDIVAFFTSYLNREKIDLILDINRGFTSDIVGWNDFEKDFTEFLSSWYSL